MTTLRFNERKATEAAALLLKLRGGRMSHLKLIKLLYLSDREALLRWGRPITTDKYVSMNHGPVTSRVLELVNDGSSPEEPRYWDLYISARENHEVGLLADPPEEELSRAEEQVIRHVFSQHGHKNRWELVKYTHELPEWQDPEGSAIPISYLDILRAGGMSDADAAEIDAELQSLSLLDQVLTPA